MFRSVRDRKHTGAILARLPMAVLHALDTEITKERRASPLLKYCNKEIQHGLQAYANVATHL